MAVARATTRTAHGNLRCECGDPACSGTVPAVAEAHRGLSGRLLVIPSHLNGATVVRAADRFFVVQPKRRLERARNGLQ